MTNQSVLRKLYKIYDHVWPFTEWRAKVRKGDKYSFVNETGNLITLLIYDEAYSFVSGFACVRRGKGYGFINRRGKEVVECNYPTYHSAKSALDIYIKKNHQIKTDDKEI